MGTAREDFAAQSLEGIFFLMGHKSFMAKLWDFVLETAGECECLDGCIYFV